MVTHTITRIDRECIYRTNGARDLVSNPCLSTIYDLPAQGNVKHTCTDRFNMLEEDTCICMFQSKGRILLLGDFNARVGKSNDVGDVIGMLEEASCNLLIELLQNCNLMICNGRTMLNDPQWT